MPRVFQLTGPAAAAQGDPEIDGLADFSVVKVEKMKGCIEVTVRDSESPGEQEEVDNAIFYLNQLGFSEINT